MLITDSIPETAPHAFTFGTFDGVHLGHHALIQALKATGHPTAILTFAAHPLKTLSPEQVPPLITPLAIKLTLLKEQGVDLTITIPFSPKFASTPYDLLLKSLPMSHLILGEDAAFGHKKGGTQEAVRIWGEAHRIPVQYIAKTIPASSKKIRDAIISGDLTLAESYLGRPHLLYVPAETTRFSVAGLAMPPDDSYILSTRTLPPSVMGHTLGRPAPAKQRPASRCIGTLQAGWMQLSTSFPEPTILRFNPRESHVLTYPVALWDFPMSANRLSSMR